MMIIIPLSDYLSLGNDPAKLKQLPLVKGWKEVIE